MNILERDGYVLEWVQLSPQLNILERDGYVLEWVWFSPHLNIMDRLVTYWNGFRV